MDAINQSLEPLARQVFEHFKGEHPVKISLELKIENGSVRDEQYTQNYTLIIGEEMQVFFGKTFDGVFETAKLGFKTVDLKRKAAADKLREQANAIEYGDAPLPE